MTKGKWCPSSCGGCSCHINPPCSHCVEHFTCPECGSLQDEPNPNCEECGEDKQ